MTNSPPPTAPLKIFISAAEPSGDLIAAEVMDHLPDATFIGIGGDQMLKRGLSSLFPMSELTVMGFTQVIPRLFSILRRISQTAQYILDENPDVVLTVDAYSFHSRLAKKLRRQGYKGRLIQYVPPAVWAWKPSRAKSMAKYYDHVLCIFPFEPAYFERVGLPATYVGNPAIYRLEPKDPTFRERYQIADNAPVITILPGSRQQEITKLLPIYLDAAKLILEKRNEAAPKPCFIIPTFPHFAEEIRSIAAAKDINVTILTDPSEKYACFYESTVAIAASGTVALELAAYGVPTIIGYITSRLNYWLIRRLISVKYCCTVNILADRPIVPELIQDDCTAEAIANRAIPLIEGASREDGAPSAQEDIAAIISLLRCPEDAHENDGTKITPPQAMVAHLISLDQIESKRTSK